MNNQKTPPKATTYQQQEVRNEDDRKTKVLQEESEEKDISENRKVGRPKKPKVMKSENQQSSTALAALRETKDIERRKKKKKQRHRDFPKKTKWDEIVGNCFRDIIPAHRLPLNRVVMQRYDNMRRTQGNRTTIHEYAKQLLDEMLLVWKKTTFYDKRYLHNADY